MSGYNKLKKSELVEILEQIDKDENEGCERGTLSRFTRAELMEEAQRREPEEGDVMLSCATASQVVAEWDARGEQSALIQEFDPEEVFGAAYCLVGEYLRGKNYGALEEAILSGVGDLPEKLFDMDNPMEFRRQMCDLAGLGYHAHSADIINFIADKLNIVVIC